MIFFPVLKHRELGSDWLFFFFLAVMKAHELSCIWSYYCVSVFQKCTVLCRNHVLINLAITGLINIDFSIDLFNSFPEKSEFFYLVLVVA